MSRESTLVRGQKFSRLHEIFTAKLRGKTRSTTLPKHSTHSSTAPVESNQQRFDEKVGMRKLTSSKLTRPAIISIKSLISAHHQAFPRRSFMLLAANISLMPTKRIPGPSTATVAISGSKDSTGCPASFRRWCASRKSIHLTVSRIARVRSRGDGTPPCSV